MIVNNYIKYNQSQLHYIKAGNGKETLLFFHGFGQDHSIYLPLIQSLADAYTLYVFDLYFHGKSEWAHEEVPLEKSEWKKTIELFLQERQIKIFSLVGFSLGGKFVLATLEAFPAQCKKIFLIAPDGIKTSFWYSVATYPVILRKFFKGMVNDYQRFERITRWLAKTKLVDHGLIRFADYQMGTEEKRKRVYFTWVVFRHLTFNMRKIARIINDHDIETTVITGEYDKVIEPKNMSKLLKHLNKYRFEVLPSGHSGLIYQSLSFIKQ